tara:strand:- start:2028 stop:2174 length:147 start_codon:yes stop_codon:yes gene_type:complete
MPIKVLINSAECPKGQWEKPNGIDEKTNEITKSLERSYTKEAKEKRHG